LCLAKQILSFFLLLGTTFSLPPTFIRPAGKAGKWRGAAFEWLKTFCGPRPQLEWKMTENLGGSGGGKAHPMTQTWTASVVIWQRFSPLQRS